MASNKAGQACKATIVGPDGFCPAHAGGGRDMRELGRQGGKARGRKKEERAGDRLEQLATTALEELLTSSGSATAKSQAAKFVLASLGDSSGGAVKIAKKALAAEYEAERQLVLPAARNKVARLVESHARIMADQITAAEVEELVERRATEKAEEMYAARMVAETEAVKAEMLGDP